MTHAVEVVGLTKSFPVRSAGADGRLWALRGVTMAADAGETVGIVGESGCGKSTLARIVCGLETPDAGELTLGGERVLAQRGARRRATLRDVQMVFQDPYGSLNPRHSIRHIVSEPWMAFPDLVPRNRRAARIEELLGMVGLSPSFVNSKPGELSGGQRQRVGIARAIAAEPRVLIADEAVSALDVSVQAQVVNLMSDLVDQLGLCLLFVAHDLRVVRNIADRVAVMYLGRIVEWGATEKVFTDPRHPYTRALLSSVPPTRPWRSQGHKRHKLEGEVPSPIAVPSGCAFRTRCWRAIDVCTRVDPGLGGEGEGEGYGCVHQFACHNPEPGETAKADKGAPH